MQTRAYSKRHTTRLAIVAMAVALALDGLYAVAVVTPARAAIGDLTCTVSAIATFDPPLRPGGTTTVVGHALLQNCLSPNGRFPNIHGAVYLAPALHGTAAPGINPCSLLLTLRGDVEIDWNTGQESYGSGVLNTNPLNGAIGGFITYDGPNDHEDPFFGDVATVLPVAATPNADCLTAGLKILTIDAAVYSIN